MQLLGHPVLCDIFRPLDKKLFAKLLELHVEESFDPKDQWYSIAFVRFQSDIRRYRSTRSSKALLLLPRF